MDPSTNRADMEEAAPHSGVRGIDITGNASNIRALAKAFYAEPRTQAYLHAKRHEGRRVPASSDDFVQEVYLTIHRRNGMPSAYNPERGSLSKYVYTVCITVLSHYCDAADRMSLLEDETTHPDGVQDVNTGALFLSALERPAFGEPPEEQLSEDGAISALDKRRIARLMPAILAAIRAMPLEDLLSIRGERLPVTRQGRRALGGRDGLAVAVAALAVSRGGEDAAPAPS